MLAIDTNIIVRIVTNDSPEQSPRARALVETEEVFVCTSVLLETEWVLRSGYDFTRVEIGHALRAFIGLPHVNLEDAPLAAKALDWMSRGLDFADALLLARAEGCTAFVSFDERLAKVADRVSGVMVRTP
jgi:predicted nucleic acid-binding protein